MAELASLLAELTCGNDERVEEAVSRLPECGQVAFVALQELVRSRHADTRWWAVRAFVAWPQSDQVTRELVAALEDESGDVRQCAAVALGHHPDPRAVLPLARLLSGPDTMAAKLAVNALVLIGADAVPALIELLQTGTHLAQLHAVRALAHIRDLRAIPVLMKMLGEDSAIMQYWAEQGLDKLGLGMVYIKPE